MLRCVASVACCLQLLITVVDGTPLTGRVIQSQQSSSAARGATERTPAEHPSVNNRERVYDDNKGTKEALANCHFAGQSGCTRSAENAVVRAPFARGLHRTARSADDSIIYGFLRRETAGDDEDDVTNESTLSEGDGITNVKRQPLDRLDEPNNWRAKMKPKFGRSHLYRRQPLDRLDEPNAWRERLVPKLVINRKWVKRQPLDRIDEPSVWKERLTPKLNRYGKDESEAEVGEAGSSWNAEMEMRDVEKRQPLDHIDEPNAWHEKLIPKLNHNYTLKRRYGVY